MDRRAGNLPDTLVDRSAQRRSKRSRTEAEDSDEGSYGKVRHRVSRACNECRRRKDRCDGQRPACTSCVAGSRACSYGGPSKKRGLRTGYVRALEILLGLIFSTIEESESWICGLLQGNDKNATFRPKALEACASSERAPEILLEVWRKGPAVKLVEQFLEALDGDDDGTDSTKHFDVKLAEALALSHRGRDKPFAQPNQGALLSPMNTDTTPMVTVALSSDAPRGMARSAFIAEPRDTSPRGSIGLPLDPALSVPSDPPSVPQLPNHWPYLLDLYFSTTHCWFPISQKHELLRTAYTLSNDTAGLDSVSQGDSAFLYSVLFYTSHQAIMIPTSPKPVENQDPVAQFETLARGKLFDNPSGYDLGHLRALLLRCLLKIDMGLWAGAWDDIGSAVYTAVSIGLIPHSLTTPSLYEDGVKRTMLGCFTLEALVSARLNTKPHFQPSDVKFIGMLRIDGLEEWEPWQPKVQLVGNRSSVQTGPLPHTPGHVISTFNSLLEVMALLTDTIHDRKGDISDERRHETLEKLRRELESLHNLSTGISMPPQALSLLVANVAVFEALATERVSVSGSTPDHLRSCWESTRRLVNVLEERTQVMGRCSIPPIVEVLVVLLGESLQRHINNGADGEVQCLADSISKWLATWSDAKSNTSFNPGSNSDPQNSMNGRESHSFDSPKPPALHRSISIAEAIPSESTLIDQADMLLDDPNPQPPLRLPSHQPNPAAENSTTPTNFNLGVNLEPLTDYLEDLDGDGLFDTLATLDSADWLANPPEFMQHLGVLGDPPSDLGSMFDTEP
ncbi:Zn(2)-C6 fungal-type domain-containing protein [Fusarium sp. LHS14.1]|nr:Zn(2)-C6 fungal-type domain-containing protein [Fusarium sp. LHS14.1]